MTINAPLSPRQAEVAEAMAEIDQGEDPRRAYIWDQFPRELKLMLLRDQRLTYRRPFAPGVMPLWSQFNALDRRRLLDAAAKVRRYAKLLEDFK